MLECSTNGRMGACTDRRATLTGSRIESNQWTPRFGSIDTGIANIDLHTLVQSIDKFIWRHFSLSSCDGGAAGFCTACCEVTLLKPNTSEVLVDLASYVV